MTRGPASGTRDLHSQYRGEIEAKDTHRAVVPGHHNTHALVAPLGVLLARMSAFGQKQTSATAGLVIRAYSRSNWRNRMKSRLSVF
jgi:hypothetical protein